MYSVCSLASPSALQSYILCFLLGGTLPGEGEVGEDALEPAGAAAIVILAYFAEVLRRLNAPW